MKILSTLQIFVLACTALFVLSFPAITQSASSSGATPTTAIQASQRPADHFRIQHPRLTFGLQFGFGLENSIPSNISHIDFVFVAPQVGFIAWDSPHSRLPLKQFELISQQILGDSTHPGGSLFGTSLVAHFGFKPIGRVTPYFDAGSGPVHTTINQNAPEITGHTQFLSQGGMGFQYRLTRQEALIFEYHYFHMSNAGIQQPNHGFNGSMVTIGIQWLRPPHLQVTGTLHHKGFHLPHLW